MEYSIQALARLAGVTTRTLRWYDQIDQCCADQTPERNLCGKERRDYGTGAQSPPRDTHFRSRC